ncbi:hypoxanthine phosphoribosyltransferase [Tumebacillus permanentifrigoris]|uniref:Hypoxanthine phosphoribosyltransferase n=1 Tax=Tumebacillus permanentifrigoris TaxID=378543 RepID=A0A316D9M0_9BACL|nr:hypoxanthine phosphoribosyltransferase [Tumebacillus permanentifrigoris]PWK13891.1 hypoxanthine phosphoribosyltransferase [Tumebacillus permanentifrigoris]
MTQTRDRILFSREQIQQRVAELGKQLSEEYKDGEVVVVSLLRGSFIFTADLVREMNMPVNVDFMTTSSYGHGETSTGRVEIVHDVRTEIAGKDVLVVDDILDTGITMRGVVEHLKQKNPRTLKTCTFLDKPSRRQVDVQLDYTGHTIEDLFVAGYGLNLGDHARNLPYIFVRETVEE